MFAVKMFQREGIGKIRCLEMDGKPYFVGKDVATLLGYSNTKDAIRYHVALEDKGVAKIDTLGGPQDSLIINESGLYSLVLGSKLPKAKEFSHWVTSEVLPSIRKNGEYSAVKEKTQSTDGKVPIGTFIEKYLRENGKTTTELAKASGIADTAISRFVWSAKKGSPMCPAPVTVNRLAKGMCYSYDYVASQVLISTRHYNNQKLLGGAPRDLVAKHYAAAHPEEEAEDEKSLSVKPISPAPVAKTASPVTPEAAINVKSMDFSGLTSNEFIGDLLILLGKHIKAGDIG